MDLPDEILPIVVGYLPPSDAIQLNNACKKLYAGLSLTATRPHRVLTSFSRRDRDDDAHYGFRIPVHHQVPCHSLLLSMMWMGQEWGNRKGRVFVVAADKGVVRANSSRKFDGGRIVYTSGRQRHADRRLDITFQPRGHESYHLWYSTGAGGAPRVHLGHVKVSSLVFDDAARCFRKASDLLARSDPFHAWDQESRTMDVLCAFDQESRINNVDVDVEQFYLTHAEHLLPVEELLTLISLDGDPTVIGANVQLKLRGYLKSLRESWIQEYFVYAQLLAKGSSQRGFGPAIQLDDVQNDDFLEDRWDFGEYVVPED